MKPPIEFRPVINRIKPDTGPVELCGVARVKELSRAEVEAKFPDGPRVSLLDSPARKEAQQALNDQARAVAALLHKRAMKAAQMRRYRAKRAKSP